MAETGALIFLLVVLLMILGVPVAFAFFAANLVGAFVLMNGVPGLLQVVDKKASIQQAFLVADDVLRQGIQGISELITVPGLINLDFADVRTIMSEGGAALMAIGHGAGEDRRAP